MEKLGVEIYDPYDFIDLHGSLNAIRMLNNFNQPIVVTYNLLLLLIFLAVDN